MSLAPPVTCPGCMISGHPHYESCSKAIRISNYIPDPKKPDISIEVYQADWIPGFAAFLDDGSIQAGAQAHVVLNLGSLLCMVNNKELDPKEVPYVVAENIMHEVIHTLEAWARVEFNEERVHALIDKYNAYVTEERAHEES